MTNESNTNPAQEARPAPAGKSRTGWLVSAAIILALVIFGSVNLISSHVFSSARIDLTEQRLFSLSNGTRQTLAQIQEPLRFRLFLSSQLTREAPQLAAFAQRVRTMLDAYVAAANGNIVLEVIDPRPFSEEEDRAVAFGISQYRASTGDRVFFGLAATNSTNGTATINAFAPEREAFLEYDLTRLVSELGRRGKPVIALFDGIGLSGNPQLRQPVQQSLQQMQQFFDVRQMAGDVDKLPAGTRIVMVVHPQDLSERTLYTIDQWTLSGGATIAFVDPWAENQIGPRGQPPADASSDLEKLFTAWGVQYDKTRAVADLTYAFRSERMIDNRPVSMVNLPWMALRRDALNKDEAILAQLQAIVMTTAGAFQTTRTNVALRPLITGSAEGGLIDASRVRDRQADLRALINQIEKTDAPPVLAARLTGKLSSAFEAPPEGSAFEGDHLTTSSSPPNIILVGDADMLMDRNWVQRRNILGTEVAQAFANNGDFVINALEQMAGGVALTDLRGRGVSWRPFETIQRMEAEASRQYSAKEKELTAKLKETEQKLTQLSRQGGENQAGAPGAGEVLTREQLDAVEKFKLELLATREELRNVQFALRRDVEALKGWLTAANVAGVPLFAGVIALLIALRRQRRPLPTRPGAKASASSEGDSSTNADSSTDSRTA